MDAPPLYQDGNTLYLNGKEYQRKGASGGLTIVPGGVSVQFDEAKRGEQEKRLTDLGLHSRALDNQTTVSVRPGFEQQLADALIDQKIVRDAWPKRVMTIETSAAE